MRKWVVFKKEAGEESRGLMETTLSPPQTLYLYINIHVCIHNTPPPP